MNEWLRDYGYLIVVFIVVLVLFIVVLNFAAKAYSKHMKRYKSEEAKIKRLTALKVKYKDFDENTIRTAPEEEILEGIALVYQLFLQKQENMEEEFLKLSEEKQSIYVLDVFVSDGGVKAFFRENSDILRERIVPALELIGMNAEAEKISYIRRMYDDNEIEISFSEKEIEDIDKSLLEGDILRKIKLESAKYIKENIQSLKF